MQAEQLLAWCFGGFVVLSFFYLCALVFCQWLFSAQPSIKLIGFGLVTAIASIGYSTVSRLAGQFNGTEVTFGSGGVSAGTSFNPETVFAGGSSAPMILSRLAVILVVCGVLRLLLEAVPASAAAKDDREGSSRA